MQTYFLIGVLTLTGISLAINTYLVRKVQWCFRSTDRLKQTTDRKFRQLFRQIQFLDALRQDLAFRSSLPPAGGKAASPDFLKALSDYVLQARPRIVVECGSGLSTVIVARCMQMNGSGHVYSMEHMKEFAEATRRELARQGLEDWVTVLDAPLEGRQINGQNFDWYKAAALPDGSIDLLIVDGPPARTGRKPRYPAGPILFPRLSPKAAVFIDDAARPEEQAVIADWQREFQFLSFENNLGDFEKGACIGRVLSVRSEFGPDQPSPGQPAPESASAGSSAA